MFQVHTLSIQHNHRGPDGILLSGYTAQYPSAVSGHLRPRATGESEGRLAPDNTTLIYARKTNRLQGESIADGAGGLSCESNRSFELCTTIPGLRATQMKRTGQFTFAYRRRLESAWAI
jgi:hypothetical protein